VRIAHVSDCYAPRTGGIESQVRALAERQQASGDDVRVITATRSSDPRDADRVGGLVVHRVVARVPFDLPVHPRTRREVGAVLDADPVDIVHVHAGVVSPFAWGAVRAARDRGVPVLVTVHSVWGPLAAPAFSVSDALARWHAWGVTMSAVSDLAAARVQAAVPRLGEVLVLPNGVDPAEWNVPRLARPRGSLRLVTVMRLAPRKRTIPLLRMIGLVRTGLRGSVDVTASVVGGGPMLDRARTYATAHDLGQAVTFTGRLDRAGVRDILGRSDVYIQPSVRESFGLAALEARTSGLPVVVHSDSGSTQFIHDRVEGLVAPDDAGMVGAVIRLAHDPVLLDAITAHNRSTPPAETWPHVLEAVQAAYVRAGAAPTQR
jgi:glycosyltransferase involved in cell wall biosynthesis